MGRLCEPKVTRILDISLFLYRFRRKRNPNIRSNAIQRLFVSEEIEIQTKANKDYTPRREHLPSVFSPPRSAQLQAQK